MRLVIFQPDIPQNTGTMLRLAACFGLAVDLIEPCGFVFDDRRLRRAGMDYLEGVDLLRHRSWAGYLEWRAQHPSRLILLTTKSSERYCDLAFRPTDSLLVGQESAGVPPEVHAAADCRIAIPMQPGFRSLNVALAAALVVGEAQRQTGFPALS
ncbi:MAG TPA: tRNA (cytidine(34)-2'-O)-methyltransferase [Dongiaceae bacterium]|nr:tRNA (cytidine(34)-2'-O)-methyltransferase [Dongiaceae bacterium]